MGLRKRTNEKKSPRLVVKRETLRALHTLSDDQLRAAAGGMRGDPPPPPLPSCHGC